MAKIEQAIEMAVRAVHLMARLRPFHAAGGGEVAIGDAYAASGCILQAVQRPLEIELLLELCPPGTFLEELPLERPCPSAGHPFMVDDELVDLAIGLGQQMHEAPCPALHQTTHPVPV